MDKQDKQNFIEQQEFVKENLEYFFQNPLLKEWEGANPVSGFKNKIFTGENWNDRRINLLRGFFRTIWHGGLSTHELAFIGSLEIVHEWNDDQHYVFIHDSGTNDLYYVTWYKSRGRTDLILHNGKPIKLSAFQKLLYKLLRPIQEEEVYV